MGATDGRDRLRAVLTGWGEPEAHIAAASTSHALNASFSDTEAEAALNALGTKLNLVIVALESLGLLKSS
jgi:hypothetical protein